MTAANVVFFSSPPAKTASDDELFPLSRLAKKLLPRELVCDLKELVAGRAEDAEAESSLRATDSADEAVLRRPLGIEFEALSESSVFPLLSVSLDDDDERRRKWPPSWAFANDPTGECTGDASWEREANDAIKFVAWSGGDDDGL